MEPVATQLSGEPAEYRLATAVQRMAAARDLPTLLSVACHAARELSGADGVAVKLREGDLCRCLEQDGIAECWQDQSFALDTCISGWSMLHGEAVVIPDIHADPRIPLELYRATPIKSLSVVPFGRDQSRGAICCYWIDHHEPTPEEMRLQAALADATSTVLTNIELYRRLEAARELAEARATELEAERATLRLLAERLRQHAMVFENSQEGVVITDAQACVIDANASFERISEYRLDEIHGRNMRFLQSGRHDPAFYLRMWQALKTTGTWQGEIWNRRRSGEIYLEWIGVNAVQDEAGKVRAYVSTHIDIGRMNHVQSEIERLAHHDALTGLPNRLLLHSRLEHALDRVKRNGLGAVLFLDLDSFKPVNDSHGHQIGDELLGLVAQRLSEPLREVDTVARIGGDEFAVVLEDLNDPADAGRVARRLIRALELPFMLSDGSTAQIGASIGISLFPEDGNEPDLLLARADQALYAAKHAGKGVFRYYRA